MDSHLGYDRYERSSEPNYRRDVLLNFLGTDLYERQGKAITNFSNTLPTEQSDLAQAITKDPYNFDFLTLRERYDEKELKDALIEKVNNFLMELGTGFAYMGKNIEWREKLDTICDMLVGLRKRLKIAKATGAYSVYGEDEVMYCFYDRELERWFDYTRVEILKIVSSMCGDIGVHKMRFRKKYIE